MVNDPIADMLTRIKNAYLAGHQTVEVPYSKVKAKIGKILVKERYMKKLKIKDEKLKIKSIICELRYPDNQPAMSNFKRVSKPGRKVYVGWDRIPRTLGGYGVTVISTSKGIMTDKEARKKRLGGEVICQVW